MELHGNIYYASWGYNQTNINFYFVWKDKNKLKAAPMQSIVKETGFMSGEAMPDMTKPVELKDAKVVKSLADGSYLQLGKKILFIWDGKAKFVSWYA